MPRLAKAIFVLVALLVLGVGSALAQSAMGVSLGWPGASRSRPLGNGARFHLAFAEHAELWATNVNVPATATQANALQGITISYVRGVAKRSVRRIFNLDGLLSMIFGLPFWIALVFTMLLERIIPVEANTKLFRAGFLHDIAWFFYEPILHSMILATYVALLEKIYTRYFSFLTISRINATPAWVRFAVALLLLDLGYWVQHIINHKVPFLWKLHSVHHSQRELNFFTDFRYHPLEYVVRHTFITVPFFFLNVNPPAIVGFAVVKTWYSRFYHGNIRTNLGPLKYILVTPQSHRVHHSLEEKHRDLNFGSIFSFWDFLFRTQYRGFDEYPATGIEEENFPYEREISLKSLVLTPWIQMVHPFSRQSRSELVSRETIGQRATQNS